MSLDGIPAQSSNPDQSAGLTPSLGLSVAGGSNPLSLMFPPPLHLGESSHPQVSEGGQQNLGFALPTSPGFFLNLSEQASMDFGMDQFWSDDAFKYT